MTTLLGKYRGAAVYEVEEFDSSAGKKISSKMMAKAVHPGRQNMHVDFVEVAGTPEKAYEKIKKAIDRFLDEHDIAQFENDFLTDSEDQ